jgi:polysaccharide export outer membrane protein
LFKSDQDYAFATDTVNFVADYRIAPYDKLSIRVYTNSGSRMMDVFAGVIRDQGGSPVGNQSVGSLTDEIKVDAQGNVRLPLVGEIGLKGMTTAEAEKIIEERFTKFYVEPFAQVNVINKRVMVFRGQGGDGKVVVLENEHTTVIEAIAMAGGIGDKGKAKSARLIRKEGDKFKIYQINLASVDGLTGGHMPVAANDIIYFDQVKGYTRSLTSDLSTVVGLLTSIIFIYEIFLRNQ